MTEDTTIETIAFHRWGVQLSGSSGRFAEPGWAYEELVPHPCPDCGGELHSLRKPYVSAGKQYRYVALVCPSCPARFQLSDLGLKTYTDLTRAGPAAERRPRPPSRQPTPKGSRDDQRQAEILRYWRSVELFGAPLLDRADPKHHRWEPQPGEPMPWQEAHPLQAIGIANTQVWRHTIYGGLFDLEWMHRRLEDVFGSSGIDVDERVPRGRSALFAVVADDRGHLLMDSLTFSTAAWAAGRTHSPGPVDSLRLEGFDLAADDLRAAFADVPADPNHSTTQDDLLELVDLAAKRLGIADLLQPYGLQVHSTRTTKRSDDDLHHDFLNSFHANDLAMVAKSVGSDGAGAALSDFLTPRAQANRSPRIDVRAQDSTDAIVEMLAPSRVPSARWPADIRQSLATSQQLAVNTVQDRLAEASGLMAVNGPPGTGKTTLLRDLIATIVTNRAEQLATLPNPQAAFADRIVGWRSGKYERIVRPLIDQLAGFEVVVASANNGAVANVTKEIPQLGAIDESWLATSDYFREHASRTLGAPAWAMIAAALGNRDNRKAFVNRFWYGSMPSPQTKESEAGFHDWLNVPPFVPKSWAEEVADFRSATEAEREIRETRLASDDALRSLPGLERQTSRLADHYARAVAGHDRARSVESDAEVEFGAARGAADMARTARHDHRGTKPGVWEIIFTFGRTVRRWDREDAQLAEQVKVAQSAESNATARLAAARYENEAAATLANSAREALLSAEQSLAEARRLCAQARDLYGEHVPDETWRDDHERRELNAPWFDEAWNAARTEVFLAALRLHRAFLRLAAPTILPNMRAAIDIIMGQVPSDAAPAALLAAWQTLFMVVPVISTTFASAPYLFKHLGREALGWLLIDEAGQSGPQTAVGTIWRAQRVVAIGDPLQLEPVVTTMHTTQAALARHHGVAEEWLPGRTSVQMLADAVTPIGSWVPGPDEEPLWVGAPLRVHRRCEDPMFNVVNRTVYDGLMIHAVPPRGNLLPVAPSTWIDIGSSARQGHWAPAEGLATMELLTYLSGFDIDGQDVLVLAPFRKVAAELKNLLKPQNAFNRVGTIHVAQGREADIVVLVLGGDPLKPGAMTWAASRPNLFNVAVSRAKQRLYVIGNRQAWSTQRYFNALAASLPVVTEVRALVHNCPTSRSRWPASREGQGVL